MFNHVAWIYRTGLKINDSILEAAHYFVTQKSKAPNTCYVRPELLQQREMEIQSKYGLIVVKTSDKVPSGQLLIGVV
jgi:hypothetical protein